jgi:hypothetical protein
MIHPKVISAGLAGAVVTILAWAIPPLHDAPSEVIAAMTTVVSFVAGYFTPSAGP